MASDNSFANPGNPQENYVPFVNGRRTFTGYLTDAGTVTVTVYDEDDLDKPSQSSHIPVDPPYAYEITVPATASTGPVPGFQVTVKLIDPVSGNVVPTAMNRFTLTPLKPNRGAANGTLGIPEAQLVGGIAVINAQSYSTVEDIIIRVTDDFGREAFSSVIHMNSGGLYYAVTIPDTAMVGPPETFPLTVELLDSNTGQRVTTQDRLFNVAVMSAQTGLTGGGAVAGRPRASWPAACAPSTRPTAGPRTSSSRSPTPPASPASATPAACWPTASSASRSSPRARRRTPAPCPATARPARP